MLICLLSSRVHPCLCNTLTSASVNAKILQNVDAHYILIPQNVDDRYIFILQNVDVNTKWH